MEKVLSNDRKFLATAPQIHEGIESFKIQRSAQTGKSLSFRQATDMLLLEALQANGIAIEVDNAQPG